MSKTDTIFAALIAAVLLAAWACWYQVSSAQVRACEADLTACAEAYYNNK